VRGRLKFRAFGGWSAFCMFCGTLAAFAAEPQGPRGCYSLSLGSWKPQADDRTAKFFQVPAKVELTDVLGKESFAKGRYLIKPLSEAPRRQSYWWTDKKGQTRMAWTDGFTGVSITLRFDGGSGYGQAETFEDGKPDFHRSASATARRTPCP